MKKNIFIKLINSFVLIALLAPISALAQNSELRQLLNQTVTVDHEHIKIRAHILAEHHEFKVQDDLLYYWFLSGDIHHTRGGYSGKILEGEYTEFFNNNALKTKGNFHLGLKHGVWTTWNEEGEHIDVTTWKKGVKHGSFKTYSSTGELEKTGNYKNGILHGKLTIHNNGAITEEFYKEGKLVENKEEIESLAKEETKKTQKEKKAKKRKEKKDED